MNPSRRDGWLPSAGPGAPGAPQHTDGIQASQQRALGGFGQQGIPGQPGGPVLPPPPNAFANTRCETTAPFYPSVQPNGHNLPTLSGLTQPSPHQSGQGGAPLPQQQQQLTVSHPHPQGQQGLGYSLPTLGQAMHHQTPQAQSDLEREREKRERDIMVERQARDRHRQQQQEDIANREREQREREYRERQQREQEQQQQQPAPQLHQNHTGSIPIHQPVASKVPTAIHGPNGILSSLGGGGGSNIPGAPLGAPSGPVNIFGGPSQPSESAPRSFMQQASQGPQQQQHQPSQQFQQQHQQLLGFNGTPGVHQMPGTVAGLPQGQQPILNTRIFALKKHDHSVGKHLLNHCQTMDHQVSGIESNEEPYHTITTLMIERAAAEEARARIQEYLESYAVHPHEVILPSIEDDIHYDIKVSSSESPEWPPNFSGDIERASAALLSAASNNEDSIPLPEGLSSQLSLHTHADATSTELLTPRLRSTSSIEMSELLKDMPSGESTSRHHSTAESNQSAYVYYTPRQRSMNSIETSESVKSFSATHSASRNVSATDQIRCPSVTALESHTSVMVPSVQIKLNNRPDAAITPKKPPGIPQNVAKGSCYLGVLASWLKDALSYLDQVKVQFVDQEGVYNRFLDIMKDFKSQAIDTPGVIERVSTLFAGHPNLIQGFNTFLPPGYRIECGTGDDASTIRVTTPMGTTVQSIPPRPPSDPVNGTAVANGIAHVGRQSYHEQGLRPANSNWSENGSVAPEIFSPSGRAIAPPTFGQPQSQATQIESQAHRDQQAAAANAAAIAHQQEQRGVSQLQNAVSAATSGPQASRQSLMQISPSGGPSASIGQSALSINGTGPGMQQSAQAGMEKRGPVEFNHAISYVNKIKNRFSSQPEIYKQFLEILQTYQRESKPIQDVYAQVTHLFNAAPDLLEDFKQFLPESAAQAKAQAAARQAAEDAAILSNVRNEGFPAGGQGVPAQQTPGGHRTEIKMPPVGNFAPPPSVGKENKKRRNVTGAQGMIGSAATPSSLAADIGNAAIGSGARSGAIQGGSINKRSKTHHAKPTQLDAPAVSPTLTPALPDPIPSTTTSGASTEELAFFDRVKKFIGNKQTMNEFLKLCNLFSQDLIDKNDLVHKVSSFIGGNPELMTWFKRFVGYEGKDEVIENRPKAGSSRVTLSSCRGLGPSYRLLPQREREKLCSGRDEMCHQVLNDEWASHPTWASEDSGFVAHRKNQYEEALHRIEEERHDYDFNIEACLRTIQLLEPIAQQIMMMSEEERAGFTLPTGIGGQSETIYQRVIKKIYDREKGQRVIDDMFKAPCAVVPLLLFRLKQKAEEWKASQREWEKVWREQTQKMFWKSLDHQGLSAKNNDKKQFQSKTLQSEIQTRYEEQKRLRIVPWNSISRYQFDYSFQDTEVIYDASHLLLTFIEHAVANVADRLKLETFIKDFIPTFFGLEKEKFQQQMKDVYINSPNDEEVDDDTPAPEEPSRGRRGVNSKKNTDLLRGVLERGRNGKQTRKEKEGSAVPGSKESTPEVGSVLDEDMTPSLEFSTENGVAEPTIDKWISHPASGNSRTPSRRDIPTNEPYRRDSFNLYSNLNIYCFFRMFQILYERLNHIKAVEKKVHEDVRRAKAPKAAHDLRLMDRSPQDFFSDISAHANYYHQITRMCEEVVKGELDMIQLEEALRRYYMQNGWQLYTFDKMLNAVVKYALQIQVSDTKDKSNDIVNLFLKDRQNDETTHDVELNYRKQVEKLTKEGDIYRITFKQNTMAATVQIFKKDDPTFEVNELTAEAEWSYYISSYTMVEPTEGVPLSRVHDPFLRRNLPDKESGDANDTDGYKSLLPNTNSENLVIRVCVHSYKMLYEPHTEEWWLQDHAFDEQVAADAENIKKTRNTRFEQKFISDNIWMKELGAADVARKNEQYHKWVAEGVVGQEDMTTATVAVDKTMADAS
ncbi:MAG: Transcriptional regulatory protein sin3 [Pycnora praestabilis]|nr:MAG: Transcriptional regulatory protein sin3 [Pycnora praestabilis]